MRSDPDSARAAEHANSTAPPPAHKSRIALALLLAVRGVQSWATGRRRPSWLLEVLLVLGFYAGYDSIRGLLRSDAATAVRHGATVLRAERLFGLQIEHPINHVLTHLALIAVPACFCYASLHFLITPGVMVWTYLRRPEHYRTARSVIALISVGALIGFAVYPTAPPRLLPGAGFTDTMTVYRHWGWWGASDSAPTALAGLANQFAAMPSLHMAWAVWSGVTVYRNATSIGVRILGLAYPLLTALVVLGTANHYLFDVLAGLALWLAADRGISRLHRRHAPSGPLK
ncbi:MAG: hypothetical protein QOC94_2195 [Actinoplanes sp.]|nr:hypothetical protein [Pseudonocardiales bacterium]MDT5032024.1 hypothetical protein [Actinoplanes sp.]